MTAPCSPESGASARVRAAKEAATSCSMDMSQAFDRLEAFCAVQMAEQGGYTPEAVACLLEAAGLGDAERGVISDRMSGLADPPEGAVLLGMLLGAFAARP